MSFIFFLPFSSYQSISLISFRFRWFRFVSFLFRFALYRYPITTNNIICLDNIALYVVDVLKSLFITAVSYLYCQYHDFSLYIYIREIYLCQKYLNNWWHLACYQYWLAYFHFYIKIFILKHFLKITYMTFYSYRHLSIGSDHLIRHPHFSTVHYS